MIVIDEIERKIILDDIRDLPVRLTPRDIYNYYNKSGNIIGIHRAYDIAKEIGYRFRDGGKIFVNKTDFIQYLYGED